MESVMTLSLNASDVLESAIRIEENGEVFYRNMAQKFPDPELRNTFEYLANQEVKHQRLFAEMLAQNNDAKTPESYPGEYMEYLRAFADRHVFTHENTGRLKAKLMKTAKQAVRFGCQVELDSLLFYLEAKTIVPEKQAGIIDQIIEEERRHYVTLQKLYDSLRKKIGT
jgi:rubrerythrin